MVKLLKREFDIFALRKTQGSTGGLQRHNEQTVNDIQTKISEPDRTKDNIFLKPKDDRTYMASRWMTVWRLDTRELKRFGKDVRWWKAPTRF